MNFENLVSLDLKSDEKQYNPSVLKRKNQVLKQLNKTYKEQFELVDWYITVMEEGNNVKDIV